MHAGAKQTRELRWQVPSQSPCFSIKMKRLVGCALVLMFLVGGCHQSETSETPVIEVNGISLTKEAVDREIACRLALVVSCRPRVQGAKLERVKHRIEASVTNEIVSGLLFLTAAKQRGISADEAVTNQVLLRYKRTFASQEKDFGTLTDKLAKDGLATIFTNCVERDIAREAYLGAVHGEELRLSEKDVDALLDRIRTFNATANATNTLAYAKATNLWQRIQSGEDFAALADAESEDPEKKKTAVRLANARKWISAESPDIGMPSPN